MTDRDPAGYAVDVAYPDHFHRETMPTWLHAAATALGYAAPDPSTPYRWCELGCGGGMNVLLAAAANPVGRFTGIDIDAGAVARATELAARAGSGNARFLAADLADADVPACGDDTFDFVVTHGVWSWVPERVRAGMRRFVQRRLAPGGLAYVGYMTHPGASPLAAIARLLREHARHQPDADAATRARNALGFVRRAAEAGTGAFAEHPGLLRQLEAMEREDPAYLAHEFLAGDWQPQHAADTIRAFAAIGCGHLGSATPIENIDALSVPGDAQPLLRELPPGPLAETFRDVARNQSLRRDLYQPQPVALSAERHLQALDAIRYAALPGSPAGGGMTLRTRIGPVPAPAELFDPVLRTLAGGAQSFAQLRALPAYRDAPGLLNQVLQTLLWAGLAHPLRGDALPAPSAPALDALLQAPALRSGRHRWRTAAAFGSALEESGA